MSVTVGIDLGTTNSCIAVHRDTEIPNRDELVESGRLVELGNSLVITAADMAPITPSAVWISADGEVVVGQAAAQYAAMAGEPPPATLFKRRMGWSGSVQAGHRAITPTEASAHVLRHLKAIAEDVLGVPVERAVVTVPAHFETPAKNATTDAAQQAGLEVVDTLIEPVAGALAYVDKGMAEPGAPRTFLVYDLGGGTFDVTVVAWDGVGTFDMRATDGERFLGGFDFDTALLRWVVGQTTGYDIAFDETVPEQATSRAKLLRHMERLKIELSHQTMTTLLEQHLVDRNGNVANLRLTVDRARFEGLIEPHVTSSLEITRRVCATAGVGPDDIDEIVLVGGSTRIPMITRLLRKEWSRAPLELDPDLCVGVGAALHTAALDDVTEYLQVGKPDVGDSTVDVRGVVRPGGAIGGAAGQLVEVAAEDGSMSRRALSDGDGRFAFVDLPLVAGDNDLVVRLLLGDEVVDTHPMTVRRDAPPAPPPAEQILARSFSVRTRTGPLVVVEGGTVKVPHRAQVRLATANRGTTLVVPVQEGDKSIGELRIDGLSRDLPVGTAVDVALEFTKDWRIEAEARVPSVGARGTALLSVLETQVEGWDELARRFAEASALWEERRDLMSRAQAMRHGPGVTALVTEVEQMLDARDDLVKTNARLCALENALPSLPQPVVLEPPWVDFTSALDELTLLCDALSGRQPDVADRYRSEVPTLRSAGDAAYRNEDQRNWAAAVRAVYGRIRSVEDQLSGGPSTQAPPDPRSLRSSITVEIDDASRYVRRRDAETAEHHHDDATRLLGVAAELRSLVDGVDMDDRDAVARLNGIRGSEVQRWLADVADFARSEVIEVENRDAP